jgi:hypothetical protein
MAGNIEKGINRVQLHNIPEELRSYKCITNQSRYMGNF